MATKNSSKKSQFSQGTVKVRAIMTRERVKKTYGKSLERFSKTESVKL
jgi:hypothetical protein